jgi:hypothetical protein
VAEHDPSQGHQGELDELNQLEEDQETSKREPGEPVCALLDVCALDYYRQLYLMSRLTIRNLFQPTQNFPHRLVLSNLGDDGRDGRVGDTEKRKDDHVGHNDEEKVAGGDGAVEPGSGWDALVLRDFADDDGEEVAKEDGDDRGEYTGDNGKLLVSLTKA